MVQSADRGIKNGFDDAWRMLRRIPPLAQMILALRNKIVQRLRRFALPECVDQNELDFHFLRQDRFDVHAGAHSGGSVLVGFCQPGEVRGKLYKYAIAFHRTDDAGDGLPGGEHGGVFCPSAEQFPVRQMNASRFHLAHDYPDGLSDGETVTGMGDTGDGDGIDGEQGRDAAADVHKCAEFFQVRDNCRQDVTRRTVGEILLPAFLLDDAPGEDCHRQTGCASSMRRMRKQTGFPARAISAMSFVVPSAMPIAPSSRGMMPRIHGRETARLWLLSQRTARASRIMPVCMACSMADMLRSAT